MQCGMSPHPAMRDRQSDKPLHRLQGQVANEPGSPRDREALASAKGRTACEVRAPLSRSCPRPPQLRRAREARGKPPPPRPSPIQAPAPTRRPAGVPAGEHRRPLSAGTSVAPRRPTDHAQARASVQPDGPTPRTSLGHGVGLQGKRLVTARDQARPRSIRTPGARPAARQSEVCNHPGRPHDARTHRRPPSPRARRRRAATSERGAGGRPGERLRAGRPGCFTGF